MHELRECKREDRQPTARLVSLPRHESWACEAGAGVPSSSLVPDEPHTEEPTSRAGRAPQTPPS